MRKPFLILLFLIASFGYVQAQPGDGGDGDATNIPIDGGITLLLAASVGYGVRRLSRKRQG